MKRTVSFLFEFSCFTRVHSKMLLSCPDIYMHVDSNLPTFVINLLRFRDSFVNIPYVEVVDVPNYIFCSQSANREQIFLVLYFIILVARIMLQITCLCSVWIPMICILAFKHVRYRLSLLIFLILFAPF